MKVVSLMFTIQKISLRTFATSIEKTTQILNRSLISTKLIEYFSIKRNEAANIAENYKSLMQIKEDLLTKNCMLCKEHKFSNKMILNYPEILGQQQLARKIEWLNELPYPLTTTYSLLVLSNITLKKFITRHQSEEMLHPGGRIKFMADIMQLSEEEVCIKLIKIKFLKSIDLERFEKAYNLISSFGLSKADINKDLWALNYNLDTLNQRLVAISHEKVGKVKLWMVRAKQEIFLKYVERINNNKEVLGNHSLIEYLSQKLDCTDIQVKVLLTKLPALENKSMKKMQEMLDFLYTKGFKPIHIYRVPKILLHSVKTVSKRLKEIETENIQLDSLYMLTKSQKQYQQYYESLLRNKKK